MPSKSQSELPDFSKMSLEQIAEFWDEHDSSEYWDQMEDVTHEFQQERPTKTVSLRLPERDLNEIKRLAQKRGVGHTTLIRMWIKEILEDISVKSD